MRRQGLALLFAGIVFLPGGIAAVALAAIQANAMSEEDRVTNPQQ